jgi:glycosyltransferase involved in cell wall biosynthesis
MGFPQLRVEAFLGALLRAPVDTSLLLLGALRETRGEVQDPATGRRYERWARPEPPPSLDGALRPDVIVTAGPFHPARAVLPWANEAPLFVDVPGDPFAEAEAAVAAHAELGLPLERDPTAEALDVYGPILARADLFGVASERQRCALLGQIGLLGRLGAGEVERSWALVIPPTWSFGGLAEGELRPRAPRSPLVLALPGGFNTWLHASALLDGLLLALEAGADLRVEVTGGGVPALSERLYAHFERRVRGGSHAARFRFHGWLPHAAVARALGGAHALLNVDRPGQEAHFGSRTRMLFAFHQGMEVLSTTRCELAGELAARGCLWEIRASTPEAVAEALLQLYEQGSACQRVDLARAFLREATSPERCLQGLERWVEAPSRAPPGQEALRRLGTENARLHASLRATWESPTWRLLSRAHRTLKGLVGR